MQKDRERKKYIKKTIKLKQSVNHLTKIHSTSIAIHPQMFSMGFRAVEHAGRSKSDVILPIGFYRLKLYSTFQYPMLGTLLQSWVKFVAIKEM